MNTFDVFSAWGLAIVLGKPPLRVWGNWALLPHRSPPTCGSNRGVQIRKTVPNERQNIYACSQHDTEPY
jgi:hypothetical protein